MQPDGFWSSVAMSPGAGARRRSMRRRLTTIIEPNIGTYKLRIPYRGQYDLSSPIEAPLCVRQKDPTKSPRLPAVTDLGVFLLAEVFKVGRVRYLVATAHR